MGTWEALVIGQADLAIGISGEPSPVLTRGSSMHALGDLQMDFAVAPPPAGFTAREPLTDAELVHHRAVAVADTAQRLTPLTVNLLPGQDVLTVPSRFRLKLEAHAAWPRLRLPALAR